MWVLSIYNKHWHQIVEHDYISKCYVDYKGYYRIPSFLSRWIIRFVSNAYSWERHTIYRQSWNLRIPTSTHFTFTYAPQCTYYATRILSERFLWAIRERMWNFKETSGHKLAMRKNWSDQAPLDKGNSNCVCSDDTVSICEYKLR